MPKFSATFIVAAFIAGTVTFAQDATTATKPTEHVIGTVSAVDSATHSITVKDDKTAAEDKILLGSTKTLLKVEPGAKDLKNATRITADDLAVGDRVDVRGFKAEGDTNAIAARSVVLMSARDLQKAHQEQAAEWQHSIPGVVTTVDPAAGKLTIRTRTPNGPAAATVDTSKTTQFTRYSPETPQTPVASQLAQIEIGDQVRIIGSKNEDGSTITADRIYSGAFRTINGTILSVAPDGKWLTIRDLATKKPMTIDLNEQSAVRKLPAMMAIMLARRLNPSYRPAASGEGGTAPTNSGNAAGAPPYGAKTGESPEASGGSNPAPQQRAWQGNGTGTSPGGGMRRGNGDISQMIEKLPNIEVSDLKPGDAVVISGVATGNDNSHLLASNVIAGVEPILQSAPNRAAGQALGGDWGLGEIQVPQ
ncbi:MAG: hypothetical protein JO138_24750 [Acidobacteriaceae bacterium]|nr:hypothetical protein [Acidobacteriaceae bacterium]